MAKRYYVRWFSSSGFNYRDTRNVDWKGLRQFKKLARNLGERIEWEEEKI